MGWRLAGSLVKLREQINTLAPNRAKSSDGTIGDAAHSTRKSDHNVDSKGVVRALDITHDPVHGVDANAIAKKLVASRDKRIKYVISNGQIAEAKNGFRWTRYSGKNPHSLHFHVSVVSNDSVADSKAAWDVTASSPADGGDAPIIWPTLRKGDSGVTVGKLQKLIGATVDNKFGADTERKVKAFQKQAGLSVDGIVGPYTWEKLMSGSAK